MLSSPSKLLRDDFVYEKALWDFLVLTLSQFPCFSLFCCLGGSVPLLRAHSGLPPYYTHLFYNICMVVLVYCKSMVWHIKAHAITFLQLKNVCVAKRIETNCSLLLWNCSIMAKVICILLNNCSSGIGHPYYILPYSTFTVIHRSSMRWMHWGDKVLEGSSYMLSSFLFFSSEITVLARWWRVFMTLKTPWICLY